MKLPSAATIITNGEFSKHAWADPSCTVSYAHPIIEVSKRFMESKSTFLFDSTFEAALTLEEEGYTLQLETKRSGYTVLFYIKE